MAFFPSLKSGLRAGVVAFALAGAALAAVPAQAAPPSANFGFSLNFGNQNSFGGPKGGIVLNFGDRGYWDYCLSNREITRGLDNRGYSQVRVVRESDRANKVWVVARKSGDWYQMRVDRCTRKVDQVKQVYPRGSGNSFHLSLSF